MKPIVLITLVTLGLVAMAAAQAGTPPAQPAPAQSKPAQSKPATAAQAAPAPPSKPLHRPPPAAKTPEEGAAYQAIANNPDLAAAEAAAK